MPLTTASAADNSLDGETFEDVLTATGRSFPEDTEAPVLEGLSLSTDRVDTRKQARVVTVEATVTDDESGVRSVVLEAVSDGFRQDFTLSRVGETDDYRGHATIKRWVGDQDAELVASLSDYAGNSVELHPADLDDRGYASHLKVVSGAAQHQPSTVGGGAAGTPVDRRAQARPVVPRARRPGRPAGRQAGPGHAG